MVRNTKSHNELHDDEEDDAEDLSSHREGKSAEQKPSNYRSKHSETEQRRRSKINERFQMLRDLMPPNDQKRDKASLLLEVIEYVQFLQEKLQVYEGSYQQVWTQEPTKLIPWRANHGPVDNFVNLSQAMRNGFVDESNAVQSMTAIQGSAEPEFSGEFACRDADHPAGPAAPAVTLNLPLQPCAFTTGRSILTIENLASQPCGSSIAEGAIVGSEGRTFESGSSSVSNVYSQGLLKKLTQALQTSGIDLSQANISVQLDVGKCASSSSVAHASSAEDVGYQFPANQPGLNSVEVSAKESVQGAKRLRTGES